LDKGAVATIPARAAIFDLDGTLADSAAHWARFLVGLPNAWGLSVDAREFPRLYILTVAEKKAYYARLCGLAAPPMDFEAFWARLFAEMEESYARRIPEKPGAAAYVRALHDAGVRVCVATLTPAALVWAWLRQVGIDDCVAFVITADDVGQDKSRPDIFLEAARRLGAEPRESCVYEDSLGAATTARDAGFLVAAVHEPTQNFPFEDIRAVADYAIRDYREPPEKV